MRWAVLPGLLAVLATAADARPGYRAAPEPVWVVPARLPDLPPSAPDSALGGIEWLIDDEQHHAVVAPFERYRHVVARIINEQGVESASQFDVSFDPSYQDLILHRVRVHRGSRMVDQLDARHVRVVQRETRFEYRIYDGALTALIVLDDVRPGDLVELSYTVRGQNPALGGSLEGGFRVTGSWRPGGFRRRIVWAGDRPLAIRHVATALRPAVAEGPGRREYTWAPEHPERFEVEADTPSWYVGSPHTLYSSFHSWNEVARWGAELFRTRTRSSGALHRKTEEIRAAYPNLHDRALIAIRFVEDEIRYLSNTFGEGALRPSDPDRVLERRFGDCKDKVLLLVSMLRGLDIRADPALVSTTLRRKAAGWLPGTRIFDHAIVRIQLEGRTYWIDPTRNGQRGAALSRLHIPDYGCALVLDPGERSLTEIRPSPEAKPRWTIQKTFEGATDGGPVHLSVTTVLAGGAAEDVRVLFDSIGREEMEQRYLRYYQGHYPGISRIGPIEVSDEAMFNRVRVTERYEITGLWKPAAKGTGRVADLTAFELREHLVIPNRGPRRAPVALAHPLHVVSETRVVTVEEWALQPESLRVENEALRFRYHARAVGNTLMLRHEYETLADSVSARSLDRYLDDMDRIGVALGFEASLAGLAAGQALSWPLVLIVLAVAGAGVVPAVLVHRQRPRGRSRVERFLAGEGATDAPATAVATDAHVIDGSGPQAHAPGDPAAAVMAGADPGSPSASPQRIGGLLWLIAFGVYVGPFLLVYRALESVALLDMNVWTTMTARPTPAGLALVGPILLFEAVGNALLLVGSVLLLIQFTQRRFTFPRTWIGVSTLGLSIQGLDLLMSSLVPDLPEGARVWGFVAIVQSGVSLLIWSLYLARSNRVRRTFVR